MVNGKYPMVNGQPDAVKNLSQAAIGRALDLAPATITKLKGQGMPVDSVESARAWRAARQNIAARKPEPRTPLAQAAHQAKIQNQMQAPAAQQWTAADVMEDHGAARTRREISEANMAEMREADLLGKYLEKLQVDSAIFEIARAMRDGLTNCARRIAADVATLVNAEDCEAVIDREHRALLDSMSHRISAKLGASTATTPAAT